MTDRELLELAAKAVGIGWKWFGATFCVDKDAEMGTYQPWNPLTDDGDSLRLAVKLKLAVNQTKLRAFAITYSEREFDEMLGEDPYAATRRAIVRAAAAIGAAKADTGASDER